jgi:prephenate dehydrogenase
MGETEMARADGGKPIVTILGLGVTGASVGLALQRANAAVEIVGHDKSPDAAKDAGRLKAIHRTEWNLYKACEGASVIVLAMPLDEADATLELLKDDIGGGTLVLMIADVLAPAATILAQQLTGKGHSVVGHPILNGVGGTIAPRADLFEQVVFVLAAGVETDPAALELASNFVETVGAQPLYMDPQEHDGIIAGVEQLPQLLALAQVYMLASAPAWREAKRLAGRTFAQSTGLDRSGASLARSLVANRENLLLRLTQFEQDLAAWKAWLAQDVPAGAESPAAAAIQFASAERETWEAQAFLKKWDEGPTPAAEVSGGNSVFRSLFLGNLGRRKPSGQEESK